MRQAPSSAEHLVRLHGASSPGHAQNCHELPTRNKNKFHRVSEVILEQHVRPPSVLTANPGVLLSQARAARPAGGQVRGRGAAAAGVLPYRRRGRAQRHGRHPQPRHGGRGARHRGAQRQDGRGLPPRLPSSRGRGK